MNELQNFNFEGSKIRTVLVNDNPFFIGKDVADVLGYSETNAMTKRLDDEDFMSAKLSGMNMKSTIINESGLYAAIIGSKLPKAKKFKRWVTSEVLPAIRKHGTYMTPETIEKALNDPDFIIQIATQLKQEREGRLIAEQRVNELQPEATYYDLILRNKSLMSITKIAKDYGWSGVKMNKVLHNLGIQFKQGRTWFLYQKFADKGYTQSQTFVDDTDTSRLSTYWTQAGRIFIYELLKDQGTLPLIEQNEVA